MTVKNLGLARDFTAALDAKLREVEPRYRYTLTVGRRYAKIIREDTSVTSYGGSVYAFIDLDTGGLLKAEGWSKPAKGVRYDLTDPETFALAVRNADLFGGFLYLRH